MVVGYLYPGQNNRVICLLCDGQPGVGNFCPIFRINTPASIIRTLHCQKISITITLQSHAVIKTRTLRIYTCIAIIFIFVVEQLCSYHVYTISSYHQYHPCPCKHLLFYYKAHIQSHFYKDY